MFHLNKDRIFNESPKKKLIREYNNLMQDYTKINALKYKAVYENAPLSFILENSRYIFAEPMQGYEFYKKFITESVFPLGVLDDEVDKINTYLESFSDKMSEEQRDMYTELLSVVESKANSFKTSSKLYNAIMENTESVMGLYDKIYEMKEDAHSIDLVSVIEECSDSLNIMDAMNIGLQVDGITTGLYSYLENAYVDEPISVDAYVLNTYTSNIMSRMMKDSFFKEAVSNIGNINLRTLIMGLSKLDDVDMVNESLSETIKVNTTTNSTDLIHDIYEMSMEESSEEDDEIKATNMLLEKSIVDINNGFALIDYMISDDERAASNNLVIQECVKNGIVENAPQTYEEYIALFESCSEKLTNEILAITEKYFTPDGKPSTVIANSIGVRGVDSVMDNGKHPIQYVPLTPINNDKKVPDDEEDKDDDEEETEEELEKKREEAKRRQTEKYASMDIDDETFSEKSDDDEISGMPLPPDKPNVFRRIQNRALDKNVSFKRKWSEKRRTAQDARNAGKAVAKIPMNVTDSIKKRVDEWDTYDDDRRKAYIIKPGTRKKYFRALRLCIMHYGAFAINPVLNIVLFICQKLSKGKNVRIRNELIRELEAEIKVTEEKIEDAKANGDNKQKYALIRIKDKLTAEVVRIRANSSAV